MNGSILILGGAGQIGRAAAQAFRDAGWSVASQVRGQSIPRAYPGTAIVDIDARDTEAVAEAAHGFDVVLHALNPSYTQWADGAMPLAETAIAAAKAAGATLMFPGNVYNYGSPLPPLIDARTPMHPTSRKGAIRVAIERRLEEAAADGVQTVILRAGDFFGGGPGSWFGRVVAQNFRNGRVTYPGAVGVAHPWAYVPDLAQALLRLATVRDRLGQFETFGFPGHTVTGQELTRAIARIAGRPMRIEGMPWWLLRGLSPVVPIFRELSEMAYLWNQPHRLDGDKLAGAIGTIPVTEFQTAVVAALRAGG
jgi:nucleoside-diphosphate-sugar epimerase